VENSRVIAIGTYSGRVLLFTPRGRGQENYSISTKTTASSTTATEITTAATTTAHTQEEFSCFWSCTLPYPIHGIQVIRDGMLPEFMVITRRSIHLFQCNVDVVADMTCERINYIHSILHKLQCPTT
jgi:hypothetical protein